MRDQRKLTPAAHQLLPCSVSHSQFHTEQANVLHNNNEQKLMSYCSSLGEGLFKLLITGVVADKMCCLGDMQMSRRAGTRLSSSVDWVEARFRRRLWKEKTCNVKISLWHLQERFVCRARESVFNQRGVGPIEKTGLSGRFLCSPPAQRFLWNLPWCSHSASIMWLQRDEDALWATGERTCQVLFERKVFTRMWHVLNKLGASVEVSENTEKAESESVSWQRE